MVLPQLDGTAATIKRTSPDVAMEAVGVWQDANSTNTTQLEVLIGKINSFLQSMENSPLPRHLTWTALRQGLWPSIAYVLPVMSLSWDESDQLAKVLYRPILPKLGCNRNYPKLMRYNSPGLLGLGLHDPYIEQGLAKLSLFSLMLVAKPSQANSFSLYWNNTSWKLALRNHYLIFHTKIMLS